MYCRPPTEQHQHDFDSLGGTRPPWRAFVAFWLFVYMRTEFAVPESGTECKDLATQHFKVCSLLHKEEKCLSTK